jgi:hypothetical protein
MAFTTTGYGKSFANLLGGEVAGDTFAVDFLSDTIKCALTTVTYAENLDTHETFADITNEVTGTGYTAGGVTLGSKTITYTAANSWATQWAATTAYALNDIVRPTTGNGHLYQAIVAGTSAGSQPTWPTVSGQIVVDSGVTWAEIGRGVTQIDFADPSWTTATIANIRKGVVYKSTGTAATSPLLWLLVNDVDISVTNGTFTITIPTLGIETFSRP